MARNWLVPSKLAYYLPRTKGRAILPDGWEPKIKQDSTLLEVITPAVIQVAYKEGAAQLVPGSSIGDGVAKVTIESEQKELSEIEMRNFLLELKSPLVFSRIKITADSIKIFGTTSIS